jgi:REP element-mobilizing transposase RayT
MESPAILMNSVPDHIHILFVQSRNWALKDIVGEVKKGTSRWIRKTGPGFRDFWWQAGYGAFSVSQSNVEQVKRYIQNQPRHHRRVTFQDEFRAICEKHEVPIKEQTVWD